MKTKYILLIALAVVSCAKTPEKVKSFYEALPADGKEFSATNSLGGVKSTLHDDAVNHISILQWDESDDLGVYAFNTTDGSNLNTIAYPNPEDLQSHPGGNVRFKSTKNEAWWFADVAPNTTKGFFAYYPANGRPVQVTTTLEEYALPFKVNKSQDGDFSHQQIMFAYGGVHSQGEAVSFNFSPLTAILRFHLKSSDGMSCQIGRILFELGKTVNPDGDFDEQLEGYGKKDLTGDFAVDIAKTIANNSVTMANLGPEESYGYDYVEVDLVKSGKVVSVNGQTYSDPVYAVVVPTQYPEANLLLAVSAIEFNPDNWDLGNIVVKGGVDVSYGEIFQGVVTLTNINGFEAGKIYDFNLNLSAGKMDVSHTGTVEVGSYNVVNWE